MKTKIYVALIKKETPVPVGVISYDEVEEGGIVKTKNVSFDYVTSYTGPSLDPVNLNYEKNGRNFSLPGVLSDTGLFRIFSDFLPGPWGRKQLYKDNPETKKMNELQLLSWLSVEGRVSGALAFFKNKFFDETPLCRLSAVDEVRIKSLKEIAGMAIQLTQRELRASIVHGGARPKTTFFDEEGAVGQKGIHYMVKFNVPEDACNMARVEYCSMSMAKESSVNTPGVKVIRILSKGKVLADIFFIERYDRRTDSDGIEIRHLRASSFSLCDPSKIRSQDAGDYVDLFNMVKTVSVRPEEDTEELFKRMLFNIGVNNTDDHLKNFEFIFDDGWKLSPAYDLVPNQHPYSHTTTLNSIPNGSLTDDFVIMMAKAAGMDIERALSIRNKIKESLDPDSEIVRGSGLGDKEVSFLKQSMGQCGKRAKNFGYGINDQKLIKPKIG